MDAIFEAILKDDTAVAQLLESSPELSRLRMTQDFLVEAIPHWLYAGDDRGRSVLDWTKNQQLLEVIQKKNRKSSSSKSGRID